MYRGIDWRENHQWDGSVWSPAYAGSFRSYKYKDHFSVRQMRRMDIHCEPVSEDTDGSR
jgi:hypothetical protein